MGDIAVNLRELFCEELLVLDGAVGTELERRGVSAPAPLWSAAALLSHPRLVREIHREYRAAGADIIVADTFRTNPRSLRAAKMLERGENLNRIAVELARAARNQNHERRRADNQADRVSSPCNTRARRPSRRINPAKYDTPTLQRPIVAASAAPAEDCYSPELTPDEQILLGEHREMMEWLHAAEPDLIWIETMGTIREARAAARAAHDARLPFAVSFMLREDGGLLGGESLSAAVEAVEPFAPLAVGLNCIPPDGITTHLPSLRRLTVRPLAAYAHINNVEPVPGWSFSQATTPTQYAEHAERWIDLGATIVGGCCGTTPEHIRALRAAIR